MLEIVQAIQADKTSYLFDMHRLRKRVFKDRLDWKVRITPSGLEVDDFDILDAVYLLSLNEDDQVVGSMRLLPTTGPTMIKDIWPHFLENIEMQADPKAWEVSRFAIDSLAAEARQKELQSRAIAQELFCGLAELCVLCGIEKLFALYDVQLEALLRKFRCTPHALSPRIPIDGRPCQVGCYFTDQAMLRNIRSATGITHRLIDDDALPPIFQRRLPSAPTEKRADNVCLEF